MNSNVQTDERRNRGGGGWGGKPNNFEVRIIRQCITA